MMPGDSAGDRAERREKSMRKDARENREEILRVARLLFAQHGLEVSMRTIASTVGVGIATLYRNFPTRADLILGLVEQGAGEVEVLLDECVASWDADPEAAWQNLVHSLANLKMSALVSQIVVTPEVKEIVDRAREIRRAGIEHTAEVLDRAKEAGLLAEDMTIERFHVGLATIARPLPELPVLDSQPGQTWLVDVFLKGIRPD